MALSAKQQRFIDEYCIDHNATQAYKRAGYRVRSDHVAQVNSSRMLSNAVIREEISARMAIIAKKATITAAEAMQELWKIGLGNIGDFFEKTGAAFQLRPANEIPADALRAVRSIRVVSHTTADGTKIMAVTIIMWGKVRALDLILTALGEFDEHKVQARSGWFPPAYEGTPEEAADRERADRLARQVGFATAFHEQAVQAGADAYMRELGIDPAAVQAGADAYMREIGIDPAATDAAI